MMAQQQAKLSEEIKGVHESKAELSQQIQLIQDLIVRQGSQVNQQFFMQLSKTFVDDRQEKKESA
jgi:hypothetical protein